MTALPSTTAGRLARPAVVLVVMLLLLAGGLPARAAGTGGIEVTPIPSEVDGKPVTSFRVDVPSRGEQEVEFLLRNLEQEPRSARLFVAPVTRDGDNFVLGEAGASPWVSFSDTMVTLEPGEARESAFTVNGGDLPDGEVLAAVVLQVQNGAVVQRASTLIYLSPGRQLPLPVLLVLGAAALALIAGAAVVLAGRRRTEPEPASTS